MGNVLEVIREGIMDGDMNLTTEKVQEAIDAGTAPGTIFEMPAVALL